MTPYAITHRQVAQAIETVAPLRYQEEWDNSGFQLGDPDGRCTGVLLCVDVTEAIVDEAVARGCSLIVAHHPLIFRGIKQITGRNRVERAVARALRSGLTVYSAHTSIDAAPGGVSWEMARMLDASTIEPLERRTDAASGATVGCGVVATLSTPLTPLNLVRRVKECFGSPVARCTDLPAECHTIQRVAMCGGAGADFLPQAMAAGAQAYITSDTKYNYFLDHVDDIFLVDIGHYESEMCTKRIFYGILSGKFPNFAIHYSENEKNPINYL